MAWAGEPRKLLVYCATGRIGQHLVSQALANPDLHVVAWCRTPAKCEAQQRALKSDTSRLTILQGDMLDPESVVRALDGFTERDLVASCGGGTLYSVSKGVSTLCACDKSIRENHIEVFLKAVVDGMRKNGRVKRILLVLGALMNAPENPNHMRCQKPAMLAFATCCVPGFGRFAAAMDAGMDYFLAQGADLEWILHRPFFVLNCGGTSCGELQPRPMYGNFFDCFSLPCCSLTCCRFKIPQLSFSIDNARFVLKLLLDEKMVQAAPSYSYGKANYQAPKQDKM